ncbi:MAG: hypothetical protein D4R82_01310 [Dehalococcoidia bacterium]|nr:MAG: hypothetical protein D4R82_01310 [Dehalococcoidia bacterium]
MIDIMPKQNKTTIKSKRKKGNKLVIVTTVATLICLLLAVLGLFGYPYIKSLIRPINIEPKEISLQQSPWSIKTTFTVSNLRSDKTQYDVWIMLEFNDCTIDPQSISFELPDLEDAISGTVGHIVVNYDCVVVKGFDSQNKLIIFLIIHHLLANQSLQVVTNIDSSQGFIGGKDARISIKSIRHSDTPVNLVSKGNELAYPALTVPFTFKIKSISLKLKRQ